MDTSTYFGLNLVTGSDKVNPLTIDRPNYEKIDEQMHKNQIASIVEASELKSGSVHAITCLTENAVFFRFTATSDFTAGDTFTFNGTPVTGVLPDGSGLQTGAFKINGTVLCSVIGTLLTVYSYSASAIAEDSKKLGGQLPEYYAKATDSVNTFVHSRIGTVNNFVGTGTTGKVKFAANIQEGDTIQINGTQVTAFAGAEDFISAVKNSNIVGKTVLFAIDGTTVTFAISSGKYSGYGSPVSLMAYNSESNTYTVPENGLVTLITTPTNARVGVRNLNYPTGSNYMAMARGDTGVGGMVTVPVLKGDRMFYTVLSGGAESFTFVPYK